MTQDKLREIRDAYKEREQLREKIAQLETMRLSPRITMYGGERVQSSAKGDIQPDLIARIDEAIAAYNAKLKKCVDLIIAFENSIEKLTSRERRLMRLYYIDGLTWEQVCVKMNYSWMHLHRLRKAILEKIEGAENM